MATTSCVALQRTDQFVGRTTNWLYDHLRFMPRYTPAVLCELLTNREEFPLLEAWSLKRNSFTRRLWRRIMGDRIYPSDAWRLRKLAPRVLHSHFGYIAAEDFPLQQAIEIPWFVSFYGADVYQLGRLAKWQETYARVFEQATRILVLGPMMATYLERLGCPREKIIIHPLGVDVESLPYKPRVLRPEEPLKILFAGTFREKKGIFYVVQAAALARQAGVKLELFLVGDATSKPGDLEAKETVFREIGNLSVDDCVTHYPFLGFQELIDLALHAHVFVAPSITAADGDAEGTPFVLQQMMATGMPAIATIHSDIPYIFGECASLLVSERDARTIADRLQLYAENPYALISDGEALRGRIRRAFDVRQCAVRLSELYDAVQ